jgi:hypothetical protein
MKYLYATIAFCLASAPATLAADYSARFGPGIQDGAMTGVTKSFGIRYEEYLIRGIYFGGEAGGYVDNAGYGRKGAGVGKLQLGVKPGPHTGLYAFAFVGPAGITATDSRLGSHFQFATDAGVGIRDMNNFVNIGYSHISNAGIKLPNKGRDYVVFTIGVSL